MGRPSHSRALDVWANGVLIGRWTIPGRGASSFTYDAGWVESAEARPLSLSLPINLDRLTVTGSTVTHYFDNLLPDTESIRRRIQAKYGAASRDPFDLLAAVGRDCVGAVQLLPVGEQPRNVFSIDTAALDDEGVERVLRSAVQGRSPFDDEDDFRLSLAGAQEKTALTRHRGRWTRPRGSTPTTHIFKLPLGRVGQRGLDLSTSVENEWLCSRLLAAFGLPIASCEMARFGDQKVLIVERFDRKLHESRKYWLRLPQEDFCQATGTPSASKYESEGGPGLVEMARVLHASDHRDADLDTLLRAQLLFWMLAATDGHAKNFSIRLLAGGNFCLTPLYDVLSAWPVVGSRADQLHEKKLKLAMAVRGKSKRYRLTEIRRDHFDTTARLCGLGGHMGALIAATVAATPSAIDRVADQLPPGFPERIFHTITDGLRRSAARLLQAPGAPE